MLGKDQFTCMIMLFLLGNEFFTVNQEGSKKAVAFPNIITLIHNVFCHIFVSFGSKFG